MAGTYRIEVFQNATCDPSGNGEGAVLLDVVTGAAPGSGGMDTFPVIGTYLTATATNEATGDTSEFSDCFLVTYGAARAGHLGRRSAQWWRRGPGRYGLHGGRDGGAGRAGAVHLRVRPTRCRTAGANSPSSSWTFTTTAAADGTIMCPVALYRLPRLLQVTVGLNAIVVRDGDDSLTESFVDAGPQMVRPAASGGFDYAGDVSFEVEAGDTYGFMLSGSNGDTNASLLGELLLGTDSRPRAPTPGPVRGRPSDGRYLILPTGGQRFSVHCADMDDAAKDYLDTEPRTPGAGLQLRPYAAGGPATGTTVPRPFSKLRFDPATLLVDIGDLSFATSTGSLTHPDAGPATRPSPRMPYGMAMACNSGVTNGTANVNLQGTLFAIDDTWTPVGTDSAAHGGADVLRPGPGRDHRGQRLLRLAHPVPRGAVPRLQPRRRPVRPAACATSMNPMWPWRRRSSSAPSAAPRPRPTCSPSSTVPPTRR